MVIVITLYAIHLLIKQINLPFCVISMRLSIHLKGMLFSCFPTCCLFLKGSIVSACVISFLIPQGLKTKFVDLHTSRPKF